MGMGQKIKYKNRAGKQRLHGNLYVLSIFFFAFIAVNSYAQNPDSLSLYLKIAVENNHGIKAKMLEYQAALEKIPQASSLADPELQMGFYLTPMAQIDGNLVADFKLMQMFPWFGTLKAAKDEMSKMALAKLEEIRGLQNQLVLKVKTSWYEMQRTKKKTGIIANNIETLRTIERLTLVKYQAGEVSAASGGNSSSGSMSQVNQSGSVAGSNSSMGGMSGMGGNAEKSNSESMQQPGNMSMGGSGQNSMVNLLQLRIEISTLEFQHEQLTGQLVTDKLKFNNYLNRSPGTEVVISDSIKENTISTDINLLDDSIANNPMVMMYEKDKAAYEAKIKMSERMGYPMFGIGLDYSVYQKRPLSSSKMNGDDMIMPMVTITLPVYRKKYNSQRREAEFMRDASAELADNMKSELKSDFQDALKKYKDAEKKIALYNKQKELYDKSVTMLTSVYTATGSGFDEILRMMQQNTDLQLKKTEAIIDKNIAIATIEFLMAKQ